jgi:hypothetical protein
MLHRSLLSMQVINPEYRMESALAGDSTGGEPERLQQQ